MMTRYMEINILIDKDFEGCLEANWLRSIAEQVLTAQGSSSNAELGLFITSQEKVQELNRNYLERDEPTDVLAFYMTDPAEATGADLPPFVAPPDDTLHLGEVIISYPQAVIQAEERQHSVSKEIAILIIHGVLHLLGYDHAELEQERQMSLREAELLSSVGERLQ